MNDHVQSVLASILTNPTKRLRDVVDSVCAAEDDRLRSEVVSQAREAMRQFASTPFRQTDGFTEPPPVLLDRLSFAWSFLKQADTRLRTAKLTKPPKPTSPLQVPPSVEEFQRGILFEELSTGLVGGPMAATLQAALFELLGVGEKGQFLVIYGTFLRATTPKKVGLNILQADGVLSDRNASRLIRWIIRKLNMRYVDIGDGGVTTNVPFLMEEVGKQFFEWAGLKKDPTESGRVKDLIAEGITSWLTYSCLDGEAAPQSPADLATLVKAFQKENKLTAKVHSAPTQPDPIKDRKIADLEANLARAHEEIRELQAQRAKAKPDPAEPVSDSTAGRDEATPQVLRDFCKAIESKYPLDKLSDAQHSDDPMLSLKSVLSHLFFVLRRQGLTAYPTEDGFDLAYEKAGLFDCLDFEVRAGETRAAEVVQRGWAIKCGDRLLPIRRAQVRLSDDSAT